MDIAEKNFKIENFIKKTVDEVCGELDKEIIFISTNMGKLTDNDLMLISMKLPTIIYNVYTQLESIGGKADTAKVVVEHGYNKKFTSIDSGTVDYKKSLASMEVSEQELYVIGYQRAYKLIQGRVQAAYELVNSAKKILSVREQERANITNNNIS